MSGALLQTEAVCRDFGRFRALNDINFQVEEGTFCGLIGPNGSGKTTFFNVLSGVFPANEGRVLYQGRDITQATPDQICHSGVVRTFQIPRPFKEMNVLENVMVGVLFGKDGDKFSDREAKKEARRCMEFVELNVDEETMPGEMTAGLLRRLEMARCLATRPKLFLADEIMSGLNREEIAQTSEVLKRINRELGVTIIWIEHIMTALMNLVERVTVLDYGMIICEGTPEMVAGDEKVCQAYLGTDED